MYNVVVVEDDHEQALALEQMLLKHPKAEDFSIELCGSITDLARFLSSSSKEPAADIVLMDICLGEDCDGIKAVNAFFPAGSATQVIYVTGHVEFCTRVYRSEHVYFLLKPVSQADLDDAVNKALENLLAESYKPIGMLVGGNVVRLDPRTIEYVESDRRKIRVHTARSSVESYGSLSRMAEMLPPTFIQCHKSFIINMDCVSELRSDEVEMVSGSRVPVSQKRRRFVKETLLEHLRMSL